MEEDVFRKNSNKFGFSLNFYYFCSRYIINKEQWTLRI